MVYFLTVVDSVTGDFLGRIIRLDPAGMTLISPAAFDVYRKYALRLLLPENEADIELTARCIWSRSEGSVGHYLNGLEWVAGNTLPSALSQAISRYS